ncbi:MAG: amidohydrolase [Acidobacteria bacterium]|nr:MAG: amidohydrolase [Acidobacteriota bacterium]
MINRRQLIMLPGAAMASRLGKSKTPRVGDPVHSHSADVLPDKLLLKDYRPKSVYKIPVSEIKKAKFPIIDVHHHATVKTPQDVEAMVKFMDAVGIETTVAFSAIGPAFEARYRLYSKYPKRFHVWYGLDMADVGQPGFGPATLKELERCSKIGAAGVGEIHDKGMGIGGLFGGPPNWQGTRPPGGGGAGPHGVPAKKGLHPDDPRMDAIWQKCADLGLPVNIHMSSWRLGNKPGIMGHDGLIKSLEATVEKHPKTVFIACHLANLDYDLTRLGQILDRNPNLYVDIAARFAETAAIPRSAAQFISGHADRVTYGTDMPYNQRIFSTTFRILESSDEHFYEQDLFFNFNYHWPMHGFGLPDDVLKKMYRDNALNAFRQARSMARA